MSGKTNRQVRKEMNKIERKVALNKRQLADDMVRELINAPFKYRFMFAVKILFRRKVKG